MTTPQEGVMTVTDLVIAVAGLSGTGSNGLEQFRTFVSADMTAFPSNCP